MSEELNRRAREAIKDRFLAWKMPAVELPSDSVIDDAVSDVVRIMQIEAQSKNDAPAFDKLEELLKRAGYRNHRIVVVTDPLWRRLRYETVDPFHNLTSPDTRAVLFYRNRTMVVPSSQVCKVSELEVSELLKQVLPNDTGDSELQEPAAER